MSFLSLIRIEAWKTARRGRTWLGPLVMAGIVITMAMVLKYGDPADDIQHWLPLTFEFYGSPINALFLTRIVMQPTMLFFLPVSVSLIAGDQISGEAGDGTLRMLLVRPVDRLKLLLAKYLVSVLYAFALTVFLGLFALMVGYLFFGIGGLVSFWHGITYFGVEEGLYRLGLAYMAAAASMIAVTGIAFLLSVFFNSSLAPVAATMAALIITGTLGQLAFLEPVKPYLFSTHMELFAKVFEVPFEYSLLHQGLATQFGWSIGCFAIALAVFSRKDILS